MAAPDNGDRDRLLIERVILAGLGAASLTKDRVEQLADALSERSGIGREEARAAIDDLTGRWRSEAARAGERAGSSLQGILSDLGLALSSEVEELELRVAQLEHRLKLLEK
jgi:polyhydroxyalkanoate synthesis regulator phasin